MERCGTTPLQKVLSETVPPVERLPFHLVHRYVPRLLWKAFRQDRGTRSIAIFNTSEGPGVDSHSVSCMDTSPAEENRF